MRHHWWVFLAVRPVSITTKTALTFHSTSIRTCVHWIKKAISIKAVSSPNTLCGVVNRFSRQWNESTDGSYKCGNGCDFNDYDIDIIKSLSSNTHCASASYSNSNCNNFRFSKKFSKCYLIDDWFLHLKKKPKPKVPFVDQFPHVSSSWLKL